jgi:tetratricopeptide (TPR) repeat protein
MMTAGRRICDARLPGATDSFVAYTYAWVSSVMRLKSLFLLILTAAALLAPCQGSSKTQHSNPDGIPGSRDSQEILANAIQLHQAGDFEGAIREYRIFLTRSPNERTRVIAYSNLGAALAHLGRYGEAIEQYQQALRSIQGDSGGAPEAAEVRFNLAVAHYKAGQIPDAARELAKLSNSRSSNMNVVLLLADCHLRMGKNKQVIELLSPFELTHEGDRALSYLLGTALIRDHQIERGQKIIDRILRDGDSAEARLLLGTAKMAGHDLPSALEDLRRAVELNPKLPFAHAIYGRTLLQSGSPERAVAAFKQELEINPNDFDSNLYLGVLARQDKNYDDALRFLNRTLQIRPDDPAARFQIGALYLSAGKLKEAEEALERVLEDAPNFVEAHVSLATVYYRQKRKQDGDRERAIVEKLSAEIQAGQSGAKDASGATLYRGAAQPLPDQRP